MEAHNHKTSELELSWKRVISIWWLIMWRSIIGAMLVGGLCGFVIGFIGALLGITQESLTIWIIIISILSGMVWGVVVLKMALKKQYKEFRLALVSA